MFKRKAISSPDESGDFDYLPDKAVYFDSACQSLRPWPVIKAMQDYYTRYNSCGERVKYKWGLEVDAKVEATRDDILKLLKLSPKKYFVSFTLNTTYGLNLIESQLKPDGIDQVVTSDIEHNSVFLSTMSLAKRLDVPRRVLARNDDGSINLDEADFTNAVVAMNAVSNIDGRQLSNLRELNDKVHAQNGILIVDAAQAMSYYHQLVAGIEADAICFSSHKMYGPSMGVMVIRKSLLDRINTTFVGGGMVDDVLADSYKLSAVHDEHIHTAFEAGLQPYAEAIGLGEAIRWMRQNEKGNHVLDYAGQIIDFMRHANGFHALNHEPTQTIAFYHNKIDGHLLAEAMSDQNIMARSGYFCVHYYLNHVKHYPPLVRLSLGLHNRQADIDKFLKLMEGIAK